MLLDHIIVYLSQENIEIKTSILALFNQKKTIKNKEIVMGDGDNI
jgi:hypothetical protein